MCHTGKTRTPTPSTTSNVGNVQLYVYIYQGMTLLLLHVRVARSTWHTVCKAGHLNGYTRGYIVHFQVRVVWEMAGVSEPSAGDAR